MSASSGQVRLDRVKSVTRTTGRRTLSAMLQALPAGAFDALRLSFPGSPAGSLQDRLQRHALDVLRHRGVPEDLEHFRLIDNPSICLANADSFIVERLYWFGEQKGYEPEVLHWWRAFCAESAHILELGANIGYFVVQGARANASACYTAVEPHPGAASICRRNLELNNITNAAVIEAAAVGESDVESLDLHLPGGRDHYMDAPCSGFTGANEVHLDEVENMSHRSVTVRAIELRKLFANVDLLKIDVEGQEYQLVSSVMGEISRNRPTMFLEVLDSTPRLRALIVDLCTTLSYRCFVPTTSKLIPLPPSTVASVSMARDFGTRDVILTCNDRFVP